MAWDVEQAIGAMKSYLDVQEQMYGTITPFRAEATTLVDGLGVR